MTDENTDVVCKDCGPTFQAFLQEMAAHNKEVTSGTFTCPTCGKVHEYTLPKTPTPTRRQ